MPTRTVFISVAEHSADEHAAALVSAARERLPDVRFYGLAGPGMQAAGAEAIADLTDRAAMLTGIVRLVGPAWRALRLAERSWRERRPDLAIFLDSGALHLRMAARARRLGIPTLYYIAPQTWASRSYRNRRLARDLDRVACILPFEEEWFRAAGVPAEFVGHPLVERLSAETPRPGGGGPSGAATALDGGPTVAVLPGSRRGVLDRMLPLQLQVVTRLAEHGLQPRVLVSAVDDSRARQIRPHLAAAGGRAEVVVGDNARLLAEADLALVTSGTATLEVAWRGRPMIVMYDAGRGLRWAHRLLARRVIHTPHLSLVNILANRRIVPEFMPWIDDVAPIARTAATLLRDVGWRERMRADLAEVCRPLARSRASERVCQMIAELLARR